MLNNFHNPDILTCLANLSSDEVFTPPNVVSKMLDNLPDRLWKDKNATFLDPVSKSGVFLREIAKRLIDGLEKDFPKIEERLNHILKNQIFGIAITRLTAEISRRTLYCSKKANGKFSIIKFDNEYGNLKYIETKHVWGENKKCKFCGLSKDLYEREIDLESYSYSFIHANNPIELLNMKFDVIIGNPPYHMKDGGAGASATPIYNKFIETAKKLDPNFLSMIIPARWYAGGKGLENFRTEMLNDKRISYINDFINAKECFPGISLGGGVCYFLWEKNYSGYCNVVNTNDGKENSKKRYLNEFPIFVRSNRAMSIIKKVQSKNFISIENLIKPRNAFGIDSKIRGHSASKSNDLTLHSSDGEGHLNSKYLVKGRELMEKHKIMISKVTSEHAGEPDKSGMYRVLSSSKVIGPKHVCTDSYLAVGPFSNKKEANYFLNYMRTKFFRYLLLQGTTSINLSTEKFCFIPKLNNYEVVDDYLFQMYELNKNERQEILNTVKEY